jgi:hypothetical protein
MGGGVMGHIVALSDTRVRIVIIRADRRNVNINISIDLWSCNIKVS